MPRSGRSSTGTDGRATRQRGGRGSSWQHVHARLLLRGCWAGAAPAWLHPWVCASEPARLAWCSRRSRPAAAAQVTKMLQHMLGNQVVVAAPGAGPALSGWTRMLEADMATQRRRANTAVLARAVSKCPPPSLHPGPRRPIRSLRPCPLLGEAAASALWLHAPCRSATPGRDVAPCAVAPAVRSPEGIAHSAVFASVAAESEWCRRCSYLWRFLGSCIVVAGPLCEHHGLSGTGSLPRLLTHSEAGSPPSRGAIRLAAAALQSAHMHACTGLHCDSTLSGGDMHSWSPPTTAGVSRPVHSPGSATLRSQCVDDFSP